jgi:transposase
MPKETKVNTQETISYLSSQGWSIRRISRELKIHRNTVKKYINCTTDLIAGSEPICTTDLIAGSESICTTNSAELLLKYTSGLEAANNINSEVLQQRNGPRSQCEEHQDFIKKAFEQGLSAERIWQDLKETCDFKAGYQSVSRYVRRMKKNGELPFRVLHSLPGEEAQVDYGQGAWLEDENGKRKRPHLFRIVLSYSRRGYSEVTLTQSTESFIRSLENAFRYFGGVPKVLIPDNLKAAVIKADFYDPELNPKLRSFARHYGVAVLPAKVRRPEHKGKVENGIKYCQDNALKGRKFFSLSAQNEHLLNWEKNTADTRIHGTTRIQVRSAFENVEKEKLQPLPPDFFPCFEEGERKVQRNGHVEVKRSFYSAPPEYLGRYVWVRYDAKLVRLYNQKMEQIAIHPRLVPGQYNTQSQHIPNAKINIGEFGSGYMLEPLNKIGAPCAIWGEITLQNRGIEAIRVMQGLLQLKKKYTHEQLNAAAVEAVRSETFFLKGFRELIDLENPTPTLNFEDAHPLMRKMTSYEALTPSVFELQNEDAK